MRIEEEPEMEVKLTCNAVDINEFFLQSENFGQEILTADNLSGTMDSKILMRLYWDKTGDLLYDKMHIWAAIGLQDGTLKDFAMLEDASLSLLSLMDLGGFLTSPGFWLGIVVCGLFTMAAMYVRRYRDDS